MRVIARMTAAFATSNVVRAGLGFLSAIVIGRALGIAAFGQWTFCLAWASTLTTIGDLGFGVLLTRDAAQTPVGLGRAVAGALAARIGLVLPAGLAIVAGTRWVGAGVVDAPSLRVVVALALAGAAYGCIAAVFRAWPEWLPAILAVESGGAALQLAGSLVLVRRGQHVVALLWLATAVQGLQIVAAAVMWRSSRERHDRLALPRPGEAIGLLRRSLPFAVAGVVANAQARLAPLALGYLASANDVALFGAAQRLGNFARLLPQSAFAGALPVIAGDIARGESAGARERFDRIVIGFAVLSSAALALFAPLLIRVTYGGRFSGGASVLVWVAIGLLPSLVNGARRVYLWAAGRETFATAWNAVAVAAQALASVLLIPAFGASGAAAALAVGECAIVWPLQHGNRSIQPRERVGGPVAVVVESPAAGL